MSLTVSRLVPMKLSRDDHRVKLQPFPRSDGGGVRMDERLIGTVQRCVDQSRNAVLALQEPQ